MLAWLKRLGGKDAQVAVAQQNEHLAKLEQQGKQLDQLLAKIDMATAAAESRTKANIQERDRLRLSNSGQHRLRLDSTTDR